jgi:signal transduction histidine kinase
LVNLLVNAFQHVTSGGTVEIRGVSGPDGGGVVISNDGPPIPPDLASRVFEPFFTTHPQGTGLGLAIVRRICTDLGARVESEPRRSGAAFRVELPLDAQE